MHTKIWASHRFWLALWCGLGKTSLKSNTQSHTHTHCVWVLCVQRQTDGMSESCIYSRAQVQTQGDGKRRQQKMSLLNE